MLLALYTDFNQSLLHGEAEQPHYENKVATFPCNLQTVVFVFAHEQPLSRRKPGVRLVSAASVLTASALKGKFLKSQVCCTGGC